ncbi:purine and uridine phosphorylase [Aspergillus sclerotioniger CBS 115572]|uniref:Purine and uridine phosphorylase n=1 Tax=Aspergillus sclerotioniger CBS 115572 TaxID=1450535 RepID=A0A317X4X2_9EURO|nr:purine and uridine phosphorylase [Aspergillus sclerotioniger CBS 115572]PWY93623.1 purine and uridine phosphorylase [Aspergillus sclerotioniger CBS 115572]
MVSECPLVDEYTIGCICALQEEYDAAFRMLDEEFENPGTSQLRDPNTYGFGRIGEHLVAVACLFPSGHYGTYVYAQAARDMDRTFPNLRFILSVGIGGGAPTSARDIRLGDVVVSVPNNGHCGLVSYGIFSSEKDPSTQLETDEGQYAHPQELLATIPELQRLQDDPLEPDTIAEHIRRMNNMPGFQRPNTDRLYRVDYGHRGGRSCEFCSDDGLVKRSKRLGSREIFIHYGTIASGNTVVKDPFLRDKWANTSKLNVLCFEMEASGMMPTFPSLAIRGICDYSDDHKNDDWHNYAALTAAAYTRALLLLLKPKVIGAVPSRRLILDLHDYMHDV